MFIDLRDHYGITQLILVEDQASALQTDNIRLESVIAFPLDLQGRDLMMNAPNEVTPFQLKELGIKHV